MRPFTSHTGQVVPLDRTDVDTDQIIPKQFLKRIERTGYGQFLFYDWRRQEDGSLDPEFCLNRDKFQEGSILVAGKNFGCGSSREHAPWALMDYGFRVIISSSFADIFKSNCYENGLLPVELSEGGTARLLTLAEKSCTVTVDLVAQQVMDGQGWREEFQIDPYVRNSLIKGLDRITHTLGLEEHIGSYENERDSRSQQLRPKL
tara:strand:+ start:1245 stop:1856 length:612 start_codon:yes stop_codon:yes gene_type:complete